MGKWALKVVAAAWWIGVGAGALYFLTYKPAPAPAAKPAIKQTLRVEDSKVIGPNEELRVIWMPSSFEDIGSRCLLYTNKENNTATLACNGTEVNFP